MRLIKRLSRRASVVITALVLCFTVGVGQSARADPYPIGNPIVNFASKTCLPGPDLVITVYEMNMSGGEPVARQVRIHRNICEYYDAEGSS